MNSDKKFLRLEEVAKLFGVHRTTIWRWVQTKGFPKPYRPSKKVALFSSDEIMAYLESVGKERA